MCGASSQQKDMYAKQSAFYEGMMAQSKEVFAESQAIFNDLRKTFEPVLALGPSQEGFSEAEKTALNSQATEGTAQTYNKASQALGEQIAAQGGGNVYIPSGATNQLKEQLAQSAAANESAQKTGIVEANYATGRQNFNTAAAALSSATGVYNPASTMANSATSSGHEAADTANQIAAANNSWVNATIGALGGIAGAVAGGVTQNSGFGCWIAAATFDGWDDPRTSAVREWLWTSFVQHWYGRIVMKLYMRIGERVARVPVLVRMLRPAMMAALKRSGWRKR